MWCTQVNTSLPQNPYFPPVGRPLAVSGCSVSGIRLCLADESNVPSGRGRSRGAVLLVRTGCQAEIVYIQNHHDWCSLSFPPPFFLSPQLPPSITNRIPASLATTRILPLCLPPTALPSSSLLSSESPPTPTWQIHPQASGTSHRHNTSTWQTSRHALVAIQQMCWNYYEWFNSLKKETIRRM